MPVQEELLRELVACKACPSFNKALSTAAAAGDTGAEDLSYEQLLQTLQSLPITEYCGSFEAACRGLLDAMRAGDQQVIQALTSELCNQVPSDWAMTSGTTGSSKYFPMTPVGIERAIKAAGRPSQEVQLLKFPLQPYKAPTYSTSDAGTVARSNNKSSADVQQQEWRHRSMGLALAGPCEELPGGQFVGSISSVIMSKYSKLGIVTDRDLEGRDMSTRPVGLMYKMAKPGVEAAPRYYALWLCGAADPGFHRLTFFTDLFAGNMLTAISVLQHHWQDVVADLTAGKMCSKHAAGLPADAVAAVNDCLAQQSPAALAASAAHIQQAMAAHQAAEAAGRHEPLLGLLMPNLHAVLVVVTGSHSKFWPNLRALLPSHVPVCTPWHAGTEGLYGITKQMVEPGPWDTQPSPVDQQFVMMPHGNCFFEYLPVRPSTNNNSCNGDQQLASTAARGLPVVAACSAVECKVQQELQQEDQQQQQQKALTMDQLQVGQDYELVITTFVGLTRYRVGDVVRVDGFMQWDSSTCLAAQPGASPDNVLQVPVVSFQGRVGVVLNLVWEKYDERQLLQAIRDTVGTLLQESQQGAAAGATSALGSFPGLAEFTVYENHEDESNKHYSFIWELAPGSLAASGNRAHDTSSAPGVSQQLVAHWAAVLNRNLAQQNAVYAGLLSVGQVAPAAIHLVRPGAFKLVKEQQVAAKGISPSQFKMPTVVAPDSWYASFLKEHTTA